MNDTADTSHGTAAFARSTGLPAWFGKSTEDIKGKVPDVVKADWLRLCASLNMTESELLREVVMLRLYGREQVERMQCQRIALVAGNGPEFAGPTL